MFTYTLVSPPWFSFDAKVIDDIRRIISKEVQKAQKWTLNLVFVGPDSIKNLNKNYRNTDAVTDVLSFHYFDDFSRLKKSHIAGEIVFCEEKVISQGEQYWLGAQKEFYKLLIHSTLHILGYDHEWEEDYEKMHHIEEIIWKRIF